AGRRVLVLGGEGNRGGDALEVAAHLKRRARRVDVVFAGDAGKLPHDAGQALTKWQAAGGRLLPAIPPDPRYDLVVDGLFGIGLTRPIGGAVAQLIRPPDPPPGMKPALRLPSGVHRDTRPVPVP